MKPYWRVHDPASFDKISHNADDNPAFEERLVAFDVKNMDSRGIVPISMLLPSYVARFERLGSMRVRVDTSSIREEGRKAFATFTAQPIPPATIETIVTTLRQLIGSSDLPEFDNVRII